LKFTAKNNVIIIKIHVHLTEALVTNQFCQKILILFEVLGEQQESKRSELNSQN
jgi:hypothetical protein